MQATQAQQTTQKQATPVIMQVQQPVSMANGEAQGTSIVKTVLASADSAPQQPTETSPPPPLSSTEVAQPAPTSTDSSSTPTSASMDTS